MTLKYQLIGAFVWLQALTFKVIRNRQGGLPVVEISKSTQNQLITLQQFLTGDVGADASGDHVSQQQQPHSAVPADDDAANDVIAAHFNQLHLNGKFSRPYAGGGGESGHTSSAVIAGDTAHTLSDPSQTQRHSNTNNTSPAATSQQPNATIPTHVIPPTPLKLDIAMAQTFAADDNRDDVTAADSAVKSPTLASPHSAGSSSSTSSLSRVCSTHSTPTSDWGNAVLTPEITTPEMAQGMFEEAYGWSGGRSQVAGGGGYGSSAGSGGSSRGASRRAGGGGSGERRRKMSLDDLPHSPSDTSRQVAL